ncbi:hypothetical protein UACE39S_01087 [Ureibacillus acetophenoni]
MSFVMSDALSQALAGEVSFKEPIKNVSQIATLYPNVVQIIAKKDSGISTSEDMNKVDQQKLQLVTQVHLVVKY